MNHLIVYQGDEEYTIPAAHDHVFLYRIGGGRVVGACRELNDWRSLNRYAEILRDEYARWVYGYNELFVRSGLVRGDLSLFFLTDFSCKRTELFDTYSSVCNLSVLKEKLQGTRIERATLVGVSGAFVAAFKSAFPGIAVVAQNLRSQKIVWWKRALSDWRYFVRAFSVLCINGWLKAGGRIDRSHDRLFVSSFPNMFSRDGSELKYGELVGRDDGYLVSIMTDGLHQHVGAGAYYRHRRALGNRLYVVDDELRIADIARGVYWWAKAARFLWRERVRRHTFHGIDITAYTHAEWMFSCSRIARLMLLAGAFERAFGRISARHVIYYLHEFPYGRLVSHVLSSRRPDIDRVGFQHGPASWRKLFYFMAEGEASARPPYRSRAPIPDRVLAEDEESKEIYQHAGYRNVEVMDRIYRLSYLESVKVRRYPQYALIAAGLHDGPAMLREMAPLFAADTGVTYLVKPHPLGRRDYLEQYRSDKVVVSDKPIQELLAEVGKVYVTYSSVGQEAQVLGLDVEVVNLPGIVNESPLLPKMH